MRSRRKGKMVVGRTFWDFMAEMMRSHGILATLAALALLMGISLVVIALLGQVYQGVKIDLGALQVQLDSLAWLWAIRKYLSI